MSVLVAAISIVIFGFALGFTSPASGKQCTTVSDFANWAWGLGPGRERSVPEAYSLEDLGWACPHTKNSVS